MKMFIRKPSEQGMVLMSCSGTNAPATFMCLMNNVFSKYLDRFSLVFLDGIFIYFKNEEEHMEHLRLNLNCSRSISCMQGDKL